MTDPLDRRRGDRLRAEAGIPALLGGNEGGYAVGTGMKDTVQEALKMPPVDTLDSEGRQPRVSGVLGGVMLPPPGATLLLDLQQREAARKGGELNGELNGKLNGKPRTKSSETAERGPAEGGGAAEAGPARSRGTVALRPG